MHCWESNLKIIVKRVPSIELKSFNRCSKLELRWFTENFHTDPKITDYQILTIFKSN